MDELRIILGLFDGSPPHEESTLWACQGIFQRRAEIHGGVGAIGDQMTWDAWSAVGTFLAVVVALGIALADALARWRRRRVMAGILASSIQNRIGSLTMGVLELQALARVFSQYDPNPAQVQRLAALVEQNSALISREEALVLAEANPQLAGHLSAAIEGLLAISRYMQSAVIQYTKPEHQTFRRDAMILVVEICDGVLAQLKVAVDLCRKSTSHPLRSYADKWKPD